MSRILEEYNQIRLKSLRTEIERLEFKLTEGNDGDISEKLINLKENKLGRGYQNAS